MKRVSLAVVLVLACAALTLVAQSDVSIPRRAAVSCGSATPYPFYNATATASHPIVGWYCTATEPVVFNGSSLTATATEINKLAGVTAGTTTASKGLVVDASKALDTLNIVIPRWGAGSGTALTLTAAEANALHGVTATATEINKLASVTAGTTPASGTIVTNAAKSVDVLQATGSVSIGGTGVPGAASVQTELTKAVTAFVDTTAKDVFTVTVPNAAHAAVIEVDCLGVLGAGGAIGAGEATRISTYQVVLARTAGVNVVATASSAIGGAEAHVAGGDAITSVVVTVSAITGTVSASNSFTIKVAITRSGAGATNHTGIFTARILNQNATGVTIS